MYTYEDDIYPISYRYIRKKVSYVYIIRCVFVKKNNVIILLISYYLPKISGTNNHMPALFI